MIRYYGGYEGSGKTCMMTRDLYMHAKSGGEVWSFPGYELFGFVKAGDRNKKVTISQAMTPEDILQLIETGRDTKDIRSRRIAITIDEVDSFFNHHTWYNKMNDILNTVQKERRKLGIAIMMTGPMIETLPPDVRNMVHEYIRCQDKHRINKKIPRGSVCQYQKWDRHGMFSNPRYPFSKRMCFNMKPWYKHYDTYSAVDAMGQFVKLKFKGREVIVGPDGKPILVPNEMNEAAMQKIAERYKQQQNSNPLFDRVKDVCMHLVEDMGVDFATADDIVASLPGVNKRGPNSIGTVLKPYKKWTNHGYGYDLSKFVSCFVKPAT